MELVVVDLLLFVSCGCWYTHHRYRRRRRVTTTKPLTDHVHKSRHVERVGDGNLRLLRGQGLRRRLLRQALLRAPPVCLEPPSVLRPHACFAASLAHRQPILQPACLVPCSRLAMCAAMRTGLAVHLGRRHGEGRSRFLLRLLPGPWLLCPLHSLPGEG